MYKVITILFLSLLFFGCGRKDSGRTVSMELGARMQIIWQETSINPGTLIDSLRALSETDGIPIIEYSSTDSVMSKYLNFTSLNMRKHGLQKLILHHGGDTFPLIIQPENLTDKSVKQIQQLAIVYADPDATLFLRATSKHPLQPFELKNLKKVLSKGIAVQPDLGVAIDHSNQLKYGRLIELIKTIQSAGVKYIVFPSYHAFLWLDSNYKSAGVEEIEKSLFQIPVTSFSRLKDELANPKKYEGKSFQTIEINIKR
ncbi:MAG: hypothetical protein K8S56_00150 [Candidatus Cloacimonetes bacterium]|nr:hypothetical protein [Candidatus Cloacimonadota bacterium]